MCCAVLCHAVLCYAVLCYAPCSAMLGCAALRSADVLLIAYFCFLAVSMLLTVPLFCLLATVRPCAVICCAALVCCAVLCCAVLLLCSAMFSGPLLLLLCLCCCCWRFSAPLSCYFVAKMRCTPISCFFGAGGTILFLLRYVSFGILEVHCMNTSRLFCGFGRFPFPR